jgi:very long chain acyl-CoA dehydrogenase
LASFLFFFSTGLQSAGGHLKELQRALNNPISNVGLILNEGTRRVLKSVGLSSSSVLTEKIAPELQNWAILTSKGVDTFGSSVEHLLRKYNKDIIHEQFLLNRLANSAIDIFVMMAVLSRASRAVNKNLPMAKHEVNMASVICSEVRNVKLTQNYLN